MSLSDSDQSLSMPSSSYTFDDDEDDRTPPQSSKSPKKGTKGKNKKSKKVREPSGYSPMFTPVSEALTADNFGTMDEVNDYLKQQMEISEKYEGMLEQSNIKHVVRDPACVRKYSNFSFPYDNSRYNLVDYYPVPGDLLGLYEETPTPSITDLKEMIEANTLGYAHRTYAPENLEVVAPKLKVLIEKIRELDEKDMQVHGKLFKHFIFSDNQPSMAGVKIVASGLIANGFNLGYSAQPKLLPKPKPKKSNDGADAESSTSETATKNAFENIVLKTDAKLMETPYQNFYMLSSKTVYGKPIPIAMRKEMLRRFNSRPDNIGGELSRIIIMDGGFKEGIDLFDIKYVHIYEPTITKSDQTQVIGRGTRTCGQKGLDFHPTRGWPLYVFIYDLNLEEYPEYFSKTEDTGIKLLLQAMGVNVQLLNFYTELEALAIESAVDNHLNRKIHSFKTSGSGSSSNVAGAGTKVRSNITPIPPNSNNPRIIPNTWLIGSRPNGELTYREMNNYVNQYLSAYSWEDIVMKNNCVNPADMVGPPIIPRSSPMMPMSGGMADYAKAYDQQIITIDTVGTQGMTGGAKSEIMNFTPTQAFVSNFFTPMLPLKGMLLWHSVGTGKTCSAIATASAFEEAGYTILWVTRTTLKNDIWKNMFDQVCSIAIQEKLRNGLNMPADMASRKRLLPKEWKVQPMSYKQFSNLVSKKNKIYEEMVKRNGPVDPLRKTLIVIDEAHKLYGGGDLSSLEQPDMVSFHKAVMDSYTKSGIDSVRLLIMTATPIQKDPMELIKILNLTKLPDDQMPDNFEQFSNRFLNAEGKFTQHGVTDFMDEVAGHISYLNREKDARQFSQPVIKQVKVPVMPRRIQQVIKRGVVKRFNHFSKVIKDDMKKKESDIKDIKKTNEKVKLMASHFMKQNCDKAYKGKLKTECRKRIRNTTLKIVEENNDLTKDLKDAIDDDTQQLKYMKEQKDLDVKNAVDRFDPAKTSYLYDRQGKVQVPYGVLQQLTRKCAHTHTTDKELMKYLTEHSPDYAIAVQNSEAVDRDLKNISERLPKEKNAALKKDLKEERDRLIGEKQKIRKDISKKTSLIKSAYARQTRKAKAKLRKVQSETKKALKRIHKESDYEDAIEEIDENVEKFTEELGQYYNEVEDVIKEKEEEEAEKVRAKVEKKQAQQEKAAEKVRVREEKAAEKVRARTEKAMEKERANAEKAMEKERVRLEKERAKTEKARAKAEASANKTRKNKKE